MEQFEFNQSQCIELTEIQTYKINEEIFMKIKDKIISTFNKLGLSTDGMSIYYERHSNSSSILAIKLSNGDDADMSNYMVNMCLTEYFHNRPSCDIGLHANAKVGQSAVKISNTITKDIILFFDTLEKDLFDKNLSTIEFSLRIPLANPIEKVPEPTKNNFKARIRRLFQGR